LYILPSLSQDIFRWMRKTAVHDIVIDAVNARKSIYCPCFFGKASMDDKYRAMSLARMKGKEVPSFIWFE